MKPGLGYTPAEAAFPFGGLDAMTPPTQLAAGESPNCVNATTFRGSLLKRTGYSIIGTAIGGGTEPVLRTYNFQTAAGVNLLVAFTASRAFSWDGSSWSNITRSGTIVTLPKSKWTKTGTITAGAFASQTTGRFQMLDEDITNYYGAVITGAPNTTQNITTYSTQVQGTLTPSAATAATSSGTINFHSIENGFIDVCDGADSNLSRVMVMTNGIDPPIYWNGTDSTVKLLPMNETTFLTAKTVAIQNSYLVFANITTTTDIEPRTAVWSDTGVFTEWLDGNSGVLAEMNFEGEILRLIPYSRNLIVFSRNTIGCLCYIDPTVIFGSEIYVTDIKLVGPKAICNANPYIVYVGQDNLYLWDGGRVVSPIGDKVAPIWRAQQTSAYISQTALFYNPSKTQVLFHFYTGASTYRMFMCELGLTSYTFADAQKSNKAKWYEWTLADRPINYEIYSDTNQYESIVMASAAGKVESMGTSLTDNGTTITLTWDTGDLTIPSVFQSQFARWLELEFEALGTSVTTYYSINQGSTWTLIDTTSLSTSHLRNRVTFDTTARFIRFRFTSADTATQFELDWYRAWLRPGGAR